MAVVGDTYDGNVQNGAARPGSIVDGAGTVSASSGNDIRSAGPAARQSTDAPPEHAAILGAKPWWRSLTLVRQFILASSAMVLVGLGLLGFWISNKINEGIKAHAAARTALYMEGFVAPLLQDLDLNRQLLDDTANELDGVLAKDARRMGIEAVKIWGRDGTILYATDKDIVGQRFEVTLPLSKAWAGHVEIEFEHEPHLDHATSTGDSFLEIYVPLRHFATGGIIAVAEFYETAVHLERERFHAQVESWIVTTVVSFSIIGGLYTIVAKGSRTIELQRASLADRIARLSELLKQNEELRQRVQQASRRSAESVELHLCRLGSDLHDGPAQLLALGLLKLDRLLDDAHVRSEDREMVRGALADAMSEIRHISAGLALPEIGELSLTEALKLIIAGHERRTSTKVSCALSYQSIELSHPTKLCLCRFVQEGLSNAFRHAGGVGQRVTATWTDDLVVIEVSDQGPGFDRSRRQENRSALGLVGLRNRLESLGGDLAVKSQSGKGTQLTAYLSVNA